MQEVRRNVHGKKVVKIVLTGGPCAGKSTCTSRIEEFVSQHYGDEWSCYTVAEAASTLYSMGCITRQELIGEKLKRWQRDIVECAMTFEKAYDNIAAAEHRFHTLIVCDRGALDPKVFTPPEMWTEILQDMHTTEHELMARYDQVIVLHSANKTDYTVSNNAKRRENCEEASEVDKKYVGIWREHPNVEDVSENSAQSFDRKVSAVLSIVEKILTARN